MSTNYDVNYEDKRFTAVENEKEAALTEAEKLYGGMASESDKYFQAQIDASKDWAEKQSQLQQEQTDFAIEKVEQQKEQAKKDYTKEQSGAYVDWQKQSNQYGVNAEQMAAGGMAGSGYSESSQVSMYTTYQNRVMTARESYQRAVLNYDNAITEARLQNNSALAEIAYQALQQQLELSLQGFQYKNQLLLEKAEAKRTIENDYYTRWQNVLNQINTENALAEEVRQYNESLAEEKRQYNETLAENRRQHNESLAFQKEQFAWQKAQAAKASSGGSGGGSSSKKYSTSIRKPTSDKKAVNKDSGASGQANRKVAGQATPKVDMGSIVALGFGPISATKLDSLIRSGEVQEYMSNGVLKYRRVFKRKTGGGSGHAGGR